MDRPAAALTGGARGFTLVELLVALALSGLLVTAVGAAAASAARRHGELESAALLQERALQVFGVLEPELQLAGYGGLAPLTALPWPAALPAGAVACGTLGGAPVPMRVDAGYTLSCAPHGGDAAGGSDVLTVQHAAARLATPQPGRIQVLSSRRAGSPGGLIIDGRLPAAVTLREGAQELHDLAVVTYYVARQADGAPGVPALRLKELTAIDGAAALRDLELMPGVEDLCVERLRPSSVRITLRLRSDRASLPSGPQTFTCGDRRTVTDDGYLRRAASRTFALRSQMPDERP